MWYPTTDASSAPAIGKAGPVFGERKAAFLIMGQDRPGARADNLQQLAEHGINITAVDGLTAEKGCCGAILRIKSKDVARAGRVLCASAGDG